MTRRALFLAALGALLAACGKKAPVRAPPESQKRYPRQYPKETRPL